MAEQNLQDGAPQDATQGAPDSTQVAPTNSTTPQAASQAGTGGIQWDAQPDTSGLPAQGKPQIQWDASPDTTGLKNMPSFTERAAETSGLGPAVKLLSQEAASRLYTVHKAYDALKSGDLKKASELAYSAISGADKGDPLANTAAEILKMPFTEAQAAYQSWSNFHNAKLPPNGTDASDALRHGVSAIPLIGPGLVSTYDAFDQDVQNNNREGVLGDIAGLAPALLFGAEGKAAEGLEASEAEGAADAAKAAKSSAIKPSMRQVGRSQIPVTALQDENPSLGAKILEKVSNNPDRAAADFEKKYTNPAAVKATTENLEDVARNHIQAVRDQVGITEPFEADMSSVPKQARALKDTAQEIYKRFDQASEEEQEYFQHQQAQKKLSTPEGEDFEPDEKPDTFAEMQSKRQQALDMMKGGSPAAYKEGLSRLHDVEGKMDAFAKDHSDLVSPEEYNLANRTRQTADKFDYMSGRLTTAVKEGGTTSQGKVIPTRIHRAALDNLPGQFNKRFGEGSFEKLLGPEGMQNYTDIRGVLSDPAQGPRFIDFAGQVLHGGKGILGSGGLGATVGAGLGYAAGGAEGAAFGSAIGGAAGAGARYLAGHIAENLLFNPKFGSAIMNAYKAAQGSKIGQTVKRLATQEHGEAGFPGTVGVEDTVGKDPALADVERQQRGRINEVDEKYPVNPVGLSRDPLKSGLEAAQGNLSGQTPGQPGTSFFEQAAPEAERPDVPTFYSKAEQVIKDKVPNNASGDSIKSLLQNNGVKSDEMKWAGLDEFLRDKPKVSKAELQQFIKENQIELKDVDLGKTQRYTTQPNEEETMHAGEPMVDVIDPKNGNTRFTGRPDEAQDYMSELGQGLSTQENAELSLLRQKTGAVDNAKIEANNMLRNWGPESEQYESAQQRLKRAVDNYTGGKNYSEVDDANNARIIDLEKRAKSGAVDQPTKYDKWTMPGESENYQEKLLTLPVKKNPALEKIRNDYNEANTERQTYINGGSLVPGDVETRFLDAQQAIRKAGLGDIKDKYVGPHWGEEPNVVAHVRYDDRPAVDGKKTLFMEEAQSDWHSEGRHEGYRDMGAFEQAKSDRDVAQSKKNDFLQSVVARVNEYRKTISPQERADYGITDKPFEHNPNHSDAQYTENLAVKAMTPEERATYKTLDDAVVSARDRIDRAKMGTVPDAPFKQNWHELAMKRMLRQAAENGYDRLAWPTGEQQVDLYDLSKHIGKVEYDPEAGELHAYDPKGKKVIDSESVQPTVKELSPYMGEDAAKKLVREIDNYEPNSAPDEDQLWQNASENYRIKEAEPNEGEEDEEPKYEVHTEYGEPEGPFDSETEAERWIERQVRSDVQSELEYYEGEKSELPNVSGLDLQKGGEFHKLLYDTMIPSFLKKYAKKWGASVGTTEIKGMGTPEIAYKGPEHTLEDLKFPDKVEDWSNASRSRLQEVRTEMQQGLSFKDAMMATAVEADRQGYRGMDDLAEHLGGKLHKAPSDQKVHSIEITPAMKKSVLKEGQPIAKAAPLKSAYEAAGEQLA